MAASSGSGSLTKLRAALARLAPLAPWLQAAMLVGALAWLLVGRPDSVAVSVLLLLCAFVMAALLVARLAVPLKNNKLGRKLSRGSASATALVAAVLALAAILPPRVANPSLTVTVALGDAENWCEEGNGWALPSPASQLENLPNSYSDYAAWAAKHDGSATTPIKLIATAFVAGEGAVIIRSMSLVNIESTPSTLQTHAVPRQPCGGSSTPVVEFIQNLDEATSREVIVNDTFEGKRTFPRTIPADGPDIYEITLLGGNSDYRFDLAVRWQGSDGREVTTVYDDGGRHFRVSTPNVPEQVAIEVESVDGAWLPYGRVDPPWLQSVQDTVKNPTVAAVDSGSTPDKFYAHDRPTVVGKMIDYTRNATQEGVLLKEENDASNILNKPQGLRAFVAEYVRDSLAAGPGPDGWEFRSLEVEHAHLDGYAIATEFQANAVAGRYVKVLMAGAGGKWQAVRDLSTGYLPCAVLKNLSFPSQLLQFTNEIANDKCSTASGTDVPYSRP